MNFSYLVFLQVALALVQLDFQKVPSKEANSLSKRAGSQLLQGRTQEILFIADLEFGSNKEKISLIVDTSSGDTTVPANDVVCEVTLLEEMHKRDEGILEARHGGHDHDDHHDDHDHHDDDVQTTNTCTSYGSFATGKSTSWKKNSTFPAYVVPISEYSEEEGVYGSDTVKFNDQEIDDFTFVVVNRTKAAYGTLGLGLFTSEVSFLGSSKNDVLYNNFPEQLAKQGVIKKPLYSLFLNSPHNTTGSILFGGVDLAKVNGSLTTVPFIVGDVDKVFPEDIAVAVSGVDLKVGSNSIPISSNKYPAHIQSAFPFSGFPIDVIEKLADTLNGTYFDEEELYIIGCPTDNSVSINIDFSGQTIQVPLSDLVLPFGEDGQCFLAISGGDEYLLGENVLRSTYLVFDLDELELSIGQAKYSDDTNIEIVSSAVPSATSASFYSSTSFGSATEGTATTTVTYPTGTKSLNSVDAQFISMAAGGPDDDEEVSSHASNASGAKSGSGASTASQAKSSSSSSPNSSSSSKQNDASTPILKLSCFITTIFAGLLIL